MLHHCHGPSRQFNVDFLIFHHVDFPCYIRDKAVDETTICILECRTSIHTTLTWKRYEWIEIFVFQNAIFGRINGDGCRR